jgi:hypothetical protein
MTDSGTVEKLISEYEAAQRSGKRARRILSTLLILIATVNVLYIVFEGKYFLEERSPEIVTELAQFVQPIATRHAPQFQNALDSILPAYVKVFERMAAKEGPVIERRLHTVLTEVENKARAEWPALQQQVVQLVDRRENDFKIQLEKALGYPLPQSEFDGLMDRFKLALVAHTEQIWHETFQDHQQIIAKIEASIKQMHMKEPDLNRPVNLFEASGILLEFAGVEMQRVHNRS